MTGTGVTWRLRRQCTQEDEGSLQAVDDADCWADLEETKAPCAAQNKELGDGFKGFMAVACITYSTPDSIINKTFLSEGNLPAGEKLRNVQLNSRVENSPLTIVSYVGVTLSLLCLLLTILTFLLCRSIHNMFLEGLHLFLTIRNLKVMNYTSASWFKKRFMYPFGYGFPACTSLHLQLYLCLFLAYLLFLTVVTRTRSRVRPDSPLLCFSTRNRAGCPWVLYLPLVACAVIAGFLHYLFLACFTWMFLEGLHLLPHHREPEVHELHQCQLVQEEIHVPIRLWIPSLVVAISAAFNPDGYGTPQQYMQILPSDTKLP
ncbi:Putative EGF-like module-containing mucin-like hormone receptor-like 4 [Chelonia mydas]|uniref:Putative EGF-like module-containing mucin-like hormone receptor-like 4 n=1 Tax=Chelonia mydas TaxID=8469 RepID=M7BWB1_CHEMY|nr:Putative EGF-like module-containing mucin-like hormone receptor-like 4 [Chelonia mydas]